MTTDWEALLGEFGSPTFGELRPRQREVLDAYSAVTDDDIAIQLPTGGGKTLIGLLLGEHHLQEGKRVAYLTGNNHLSDQVVNEAHKRFVCVSAGLGEAGSVTLVHFSA